jgi:hypothetical protein
LIYPVVTAEAGLIKKNEKKKVNMNKEKNLENARPAKPNSAYFPDLEINEFFISAHEKKE